MTADDQWSDELAALRQIALDAGLVETRKWNQPCFTHHEANVAILGGLKRHCSIGFFQGVLFDDPQNLLIAPGKNSQSARQLRFTSVDEIEAQRGAIDSFLEQAKHHVDAGTKVDFAAKDHLELPDELVAKFDEHVGLQDAFEALTPGRQRGFVLHIAGAKQSATRASRVDKHVPRILASKGIHDCICGKSARMPRCDGSHSR